MKWKEHSGWAVVIIGFLLFIIWLLIDKNTWTFFGIHLNLTFFLVLITCIFLVYLGSIVPDSDSEDTNSYIFHSYFMPMGYLFHYFEFITSRILSMSRGHRKSLHHPLGILISSLFFIILFLMFLSIFNFFNFVHSIFYFISLLIGQFSHILEDRE